MSTQLNISSFNDLRKRYGHVPGMQDALDAYLAEKQAGRSAGVPPDVATTYGCDVFKDRIEKIMAQLIQQQGVSVGNSSSSRRPGTQLILFVLARTKNKIFSRYQ
jgi:hypothetical protein